MRARTATSVYGALLAGATTVAALTTNASDWRPVGLIVALTLLAVGSDLLALELRDMHLSASLSATVVAAILLGPAPAMVVGLVPIVVQAIHQTPERAKLAANLATYATFPLVAGLLARAIGVSQLDDMWLAVASFGIFMVANLLNFCLIYSVQVLMAAWRWGEGLRAFYLPIIPAQLGIGIVTVGIVDSERLLGPEAIVVLAPTLLVFQWLLRIAIDAHERGEELEVRNRELASLQFGLISTMLKTLALRDNMTARHSAAVARYSRAVAEELGLPEHELELIHTAALFHDIGKFIFPDAILLSKRKLTDEEFDIVRRHPAVGADVIAGIEGYEEIADIVLHHHERFDGLGYPNNVSELDIPLGSRIIAIADTYDVITARDTYQTPRSMSEAFAELRRCSGSQFDPHLVDLFIDMMTRRGVVFRHTAAEDFEAELAMEKRVSDYASPRQVA